MNRRVFLRSLAALAVVPLSPKPSSHQSIAQQTGTLTLNEARDLMDCAALADIGSFQAVQP